MVIEPVNPGHFSVVISLLTLLLSSPTVMATDFGKRMTGGGRPIQRNLGFGQGRVPVVFSYVARAAGEHPSADRVDLFAGADDRHHCRYRASAAGAAVGGVASPARATV